MSYGHTMVCVAALRPWTGYETGRTSGEVRFRRNGTSVDIWMRIAGREQWISVPAKELAIFLTGSYDENWVPEHGKEITLPAISDGNAETLIG
jgi:hypothetical protein